MRKFRVIKTFNALVVYALAARDTLDSSLYRLQAATIDWVNRDGKIKTYHADEELEETLLKSAYPSSFYDVLLQYGFIENLKQPIRLKIGDHIRGESSSSIFIVTALSRQDKKNLVALCGSSGLTWNGIHETEGWYYEGATLPQNLVELLTGGLGEWKIVNP